MSSDTDREKMQHNIDQLLKWAETWLMEFNEMQDHPMIIAVYHNIQIQRNVMLFKNQKSKIQNSNGGKYENFIWLTLWCYGAGFIRTRGDS